MQICGKLFLKVNRKKTKAEHISKVKYLGYGFYGHTGKRRFRVHSKSVTKVKNKIRKLTERNNGMSNTKREEKYQQFVRGWINYFKLADMKSLLRETDEWARRRIGSDCGAYIGDTIEKYLFKKFGVCKRIIGFGPDEISFRALRERRSRLLKEWGMKDDKIQIYQMAVGAEKGSVRFSSSELDGRTGGIIGNKGKVVQMIALYDFMTEQYSQLKIDTIGSEMDILKGLKRV